MADGTPIAVAALRNLKPAVDRVLAVLPPAEGQLARALQDEGAEILFFAERLQGMGSSLAYGAAHTEPDEALIVALGDMPGISTNTIAAVVDAVKSGHPLVRPMYKNRAGHPVGFSSTYRAELMELTGDRGAHSILDSSLDCLICISTDDSGVLWDIDRPSDLTNADRPTSQPESA